MRGPPKLSLSLEREHVCHKYVSRSEMTEVLI